MVGGTKTGEACSGVRLAAIGMVAARTDSGLQSPATGASDACAEPSLQNRTEQPRARGLGSHGC